MLQNACYLHKFTLFLIIKVIKKNIKVLETYIPYRIQANHIPSKSLRLKMKKLKKLPFKQRGVRQKTFDFLIFTFGLNNWLVNSIVDLRKDIVDEFNLL